MIPICWINAAPFDQHLMSYLFLGTQGLLNACNRADAKYLFQKDKKLYDVSLDTGDKTFQCGRPNDIYKFWLMWKAKVRWYPSLCGSFSNLHWHFLHSLVAVSPLFCGSFSILHWLFLQYVYLSTVYTRTISAEIKCICSTKALYKRNCLMLNSNCLEFNAFNFLTVFLELRYLNFCIYLVQCLLFMPGSFTTLCPS